MEERTKGQLKQIRSEAAVNGWKSGSTRAPSIPTHEFVGRLEETEMMGGVGEEAQVHRWVEIAGSTGPGDGVGVK